MTRFNLKTLKENKKKSGDNIDLPGGFSKLLMEIRQNH